jgi:DNA replication ATP-dependent helicase Dna2
VHPEVREFAIGGNIQAKTFEELHEIYTSPLVVATTCLGINQYVFFSLCDLTTSFIFNKRKFDYCIVDEASQITLPVCLGPLRYADRFVLVGDHYQLPPLV